MEADIVIPHPLFTIICFKLQNLEVGRSLQIEIMLSSKNKIQNFFLSLEFYF
jgi:hypothetical protein